MRSWGALLFVSLTWWVDDARAQSTNSIDIQALPLPLSGDSTSIFESARALKDGGFRWSLRTSGLKKPLSLRLPSPAAEGTSAALVDGVVLTELSSCISLGKGWDAGFGFGVHLGQSIIEDRGDGDARYVDTFRGRDPRFGFGWIYATSSWSVRPFAQVHLPLGDTKGYAGEPTPRANFGLAQLFDAKIVSFSSQLALVYRKSQTISSTTWGPQIFFGVGAFAPVYKAFDVGLQFVALPVLSAQHARSGEKGGRVIPSELLGSVRYKHKHFSWGLGAGFGVPLSRTSSVHVQRDSVLGATAPIYRGFLDLAYEK